jgi:hypothetical protein
MHFNRTLTLDGVRTLLAGILAFAAVQSQMWMQRKARRNETDCLRNSGPTAILFEIELIYRSMIRRSDDTPSEGPDKEFLVKPHSKQSQHANAKEN